MITEIIITEKTLTQIIDEIVAARIPENTSEVINDSGFSTNGTAGSSDEADDITQTTGVLADSYGSTSDVSVSTNNTTSFTVPQIAVNAQGQITSATNRTISVTIP